MDGINLIKTPPHLWWVWGKMWLGGMGEIKAGLIPPLPKREKMLLVYTEKNKTPHLRGLLYRFPFLLISGVSHASSKKVKGFYLTASAKYSKSEIYSKIILKRVTILYTL